MMHQVGFYYYYLFAILYFVFFCFSQCPKTVLAWCNYRRKHPYELSLHYPGKLPTRFNLVLSMFGSSGWKLPAQEHCINTETDMEETSIASGITPQTFFSFVCWIYHSSCTWRLNVPLIYTFDQSHGCTGGFWAENSTFFEWTPKFPIPHSLTSLPVLPIEHRYVSNEVYSPLGMRTRCTSSSWLSLYQESEQGQRFPCFMMCMCSSGP